jgi:hypothetical protein
MKRVNVTSTSIRTVGYDAELRHLEVEFHNGRRYRYERFPRHLYHRLVNASSVGELFHQEVRPLYKAIEIDASVDSKGADEEPKDVS